MGWHFANISWVWLLVPLWILVVVLTCLLWWTPWKQRFTRSTALGYSDFSLLKALPRMSKPHLRHLCQSLRLVTLLLLLIALLRPQIYDNTFRERREGIDIVLVIDTSGSMRALDLDADRSIQDRRTRLQIVLDVVSEFIKKRPDDQIGLVVFGAEAFMQSPLTLDHGLVKDLLSRLSIGMAGDATAIGSGIGIAVQRLKHSKAKSKIIVLLTDGVNNRGVLSPKKAAEVAKAFGIRIYTIGAGSRGKAPFIVDQGVFGRGVVYEEVDIDEDTLREVASLTGGSYFRATDKKELSAIYNEIDTLEKTEMEGLPQGEPDERAHIFILAALLLFMAELILMHTVFRKLP